MAVHAHGVVPRTVAMATSAEASGDTGRVVGYGSFAFASPAPLTDAERGWLLARALAAEPALIVLDEAMSCSEAVAALIASGHSRAPVAPGADLDLATGIVGLRDLVAGDGEAARIISHVRADEAPHVADLRTALSEMRDRTWIGDGGRRHDGSAMIGTLWARCLDQSLGENRTQSRQAILGEIERWCMQRTRGSDILAEFHSLATVDEAA